MRFSLRAEGLNEILDDLQKIGRQGKTVMGQALSDVGKRMVKFLKAERNAGGFAPLGRVSQLKGHRKPWGKTKFISVRYKRRTDQIVVTSKGLNKKMEEGGVVTISQRFRKFLAYKGIYLKKTSTTIRIPARPIFKRTWEHHKDEIVPIFQDRLVYRINRFTRKLKFKRNGNQNA